MDSKEYFIVLPLLLYGLAIADLVNSWRTFVNPEKRYLPYILTSVILLEASFSNFYQMYEWMTDDTFSSYISYYRVLLPPLTFLFVVAVLTPEAEVTDIKGYFVKNMPLIFGGSAIFVALHFLFEVDKELVPRLIAIAVLLFIAITRKTWPIYIILLLRMTMMIA